MCVSVWVIVASAAAIVAVYGALVWVVVRLFKGYRGGPV